MVKMKIVIRLVTITAIMAAICAFTFPLAISTRSVTTGMAGVVDETERGDKVETITVR